MNAPVRLALFGVAAAVVFGGGVGLGAAVGPTPTPTPTSGPVPAPAGQEHRQPASPSTTVPPVHTDHAATGEAHR